MRTSVKILAGLLLFHGGVSFAQPGVAPEFCLHDGDRVVFLGDSITAQRFYTVYVQEAVHARFPDWHIEFYNAGVGGDSVRGGVAGTTDERLERDVFRYKPTVVTVMLGMNDRSHAGEYKAGYEHILQRIRSFDPKIRVTVLSPTPVDGFTVDDPSSNLELEQFTEADARLAQEYAATFVDLHHVVRAALMRAVKTDRLAAASLVPDGIHPQPPVHILMAETILRAWGFPEQTAEVVLDTKRLGAVRSIGVALRDLHKDNEELMWTEIDNADELRFTSRDGNEVLYRDLLGVKHTGTRMLTVDGLKTDRRYQLSIDGKSIGNPSSAGELARGVHLELVDTPMHKAGVTLYYACSNAELDQTNRSRLLGVHDQAESPEMRTAAERFFDRAIGRAQIKIQGASLRTQHVFSLKLLPGSR